MSGNVDRVVQPVLDIAIERRHKPVPQAALGEDQEANAVNLMHRLDDAGEEGLGHAMAVVGAPRQQQVFELIEGCHHGDLEAQENFHQDLEKGQDQVLPCGSNLKLQLREAKGQEVGQVGFVA